MAVLMDIVKKGSTDRSVTIRIVDSGDGTPETGVVYNTSGIDLWYRREGAAKTSITEASLSALTDAHSDGGFLHVGDGEYRLDLPDAAFASGANHVDIGGTVTGMIVVGGRVRLVNYDPEDTVRLGLTALPNAAAEAAGGLYTRGTGAGQINQDANGRIDAHLNNAAHGGNAAVMTLERVIVTATTSNQPAVKLTGNGGGPGLYAKGGVDGEGADFLAGASGGAGMYVVGGNQAALLLEGGTGQEGLSLVNGSGGSTLTTNLVGTVSGIAGTIQTIDALWAKIKKYFQLLFRKDAAIATDNATELTEINADGGSGAGAFANSTDSVEAIRDNMSTPPTAGTIAGAVWDEARSGHTTSGTFGEGVKAESLNSQAQADVEAIVDGIIQSYFDPAGGFYADLQHISSNNAIATLSSQTQFTLSFGSPNNDAYNGGLIVVSDAVTPHQRCFGYISDYVASTKAVTLRADPGIFTMAVGDRVDIYAKPTVDVESMVDNVITAAKIASDAITAAKIAADAIGASEIAAGALDADAFTTALAQKIADVILRRQMDNVEVSSNGDTLDKSSLYGLVQQAQESNTVDNAGELTIYKTDGTTELGRLTLDTDAAAEPVTGVS